LDGESNLKNLYKIPDLPIINGIKFDKNIPRVEKISIFQAGKNPIAEKKERGIITLSPVINPLKKEINIPYFPKKGIKKFKSIKERKIVYLKIFLNMQKV
jgi:hypothetical protein